MAEIKFNTGWLTAIGLAAKCGTADEVMDLCVAIQRASLGEPVGELSTLVELLFNPIAEEIDEKRTTSERNRTNRKGKRNENERKANENERSLKEKEEEREEEGEAERETAKEDIPHTPLEEKDKEKGEEGEEEKEEEREISRPAADEACVLALPAPQFVAEKDPKTMTDKALEEEFEAIWLFYPRKAGKSDALRHYKAARKNGTTFDEVEDGVHRYAEYIEAEHTEPQYIAMGSTWFCGHRWQDVYVRHGPKPGSLEWLANL